MENPIAVDVFDHHDPLVFALNLTTAEGLLVARH